MDKTDINESLILGLDLGTNSIGWCLLKRIGSGVPKIIDIGSHVFPRVVDDKTQVSKNQARRNARLVRRLIQRRARRKQRLKNYLIKLGLLPVSLKDCKLLEKPLNGLGNPYQLRKKALDEKLNAHELGRAILHIGARRGFLSARKNVLGDLLEDPDVQELKAELEDEESEFLDQEAKKEETQFKKDISALQERIEKAGCRTLGEYLANLSRHEPKRGLRTSRKMYQHELELLLTKQKRHHTQLTDEMMEEIKKIIFHQRPLKLKANRIGKCSFEPSRNRAAKARLEFQQFRYWQDLNHLEFADIRTGEVAKLSLEQKQKLAKELEYKDKLSFARIKTLLELDKKVHFNLEEAKKAISGNSTARKIQKILGKQWNKMSVDKQNALVEDLLTIKKKTVLKNRLNSHWGFDLQTSIELAILEFEPNHANLSLKAINKLLPYLKKGLTLADARQRVGYDYTSEEINGVDFLPLPPVIANPVVNKALFELRNLMHAIINTYGKPDCIRVEMARELVQSKKQKIKYQKQQKINEKLNKEAKENYQAIRQKYPHLNLSEKTERDDLIKYRLYKEANCQCVYTGKMIAEYQLFSAEIEIDHIFPKRRTLDDSYMNKVVCFAEVNTKKGDRTPYEAYSGDEKRYDQIKQRIEKFPPAKRNRFLRKDLPNDFLPSQLNDTRYISKVAKDYLKKLGSDISVTKGAVVGSLRHHWGLNNILHDDFKKNREDHRHHAIDAAVIAYCDRSLYQKIANGKVKQENLIPYKSFRNDLADKLAKVLVSHKPIRKLSGALHEESSYGIRQEPGDKFSLIYRKPLTELTKAMVEKIVCPTIKQLVVDRVNQEGLQKTPAKAFTEDKPLFHKDGITPIKRVRIYMKKPESRKVFEKKLAAYCVVKDQQGKIFKCLQLGNNHHVEIIQNKKTKKYKANFVTMIAAAERVRMLKQPMIKRDHGDDWQFIMALHINDMVYLPKLKTYYRVQQLDATDNRLTLRKHIAATLNNKEEKVRRSINSLLEDYQMKKVMVNILGKVVSHDKTYDRDN